MLRIVNYVKWYYIISLNLLTVRKAVSSWPMEGAGPAGRVPGSPVTLSAGGQVTGTPVRRRPLTQ